MSTMTPVARFLCATTGTSIDSPPYRPIHRLLLSDASGGNLNESEKKFIVVCKQLKKILRNIWKYFDIPGHPLYAIGTIIDDYVKYSIKIFRGSGETRDTDSSYVAAVALAIKAAIEKYLAKLVAQNRTPQGMDSVNFLIKLLSELIFCDAEPLSTESFRYIFAFDNIEHYIGADALHDDEIRDLQVYLQAFINEQDQGQSVFHQLFHTSNPYSTHFKIVICTREISALMAEVANYTSEVPDSGLIHRHSEEDIREGGLTLSIMDITRMQLLRQLLYCEAKLIFIKS